MGAPPRLRALSPRLVRCRGLSFWGFRFVALGPYCAPAARLVRPRTVGREAPFGQAPLTIRGAEEEACPGLDSRTSRCRETARLPKFPANPALRRGACQPESVPGGAPPLFSSESAGRPGVAPRRWEVRCPGRDEACRSASPRLPRPKKGRSRPGRARPRATGPGLHLDARGARGCSQPGRAATPRWEEARGREGRRRPPCFPRRLRT